jgi:quercetin dioxygenase-like cupin family protein
VTVRPERDDEPFHWQDVAIHAYKPDGRDTWRDLTRQVLFDHAELACQVRFFDVEPGGHTTLERHEHAHAVIVLRGRGQCLVGERVVDLEPHDLVETPPWAWHQFRAGPDDHLGFVCIVNRDRDRPQLPTRAELDQLTRDPDVASFLGLGR